MSQEVLIPKMNRIRKKKRQYRVPFFNLILVICAILAIIGSTFVDVTIKHYVWPNGGFAQSLDPQDYIKSFSIVPQIPVLMFICSALGKRMATSAVTLYIILGLFFAPLFALGGGSIMYIGEYGFGYILSYIVAVLLAGAILSEKYSFKNMIFASFVGVLIIHIFGIFYMFIIAMLKHDGMTFVSGWINAQSGIKIIYDFILSFVGILIGKYVHEFLEFSIK